MEKIDIQNKFLVCYAKLDEKLANAVVNEISKYLEVSYSLWSYAVVTDVDAYFEAIVVPIIDNADFVLLFLSGSVEQDEMVMKVYRYCNNLNKSIVPVKVDSRKLKFRDFAFRSRVFDYDKKEDKEDLLEQMHSWLGLVKIYPWSTVKFCSRCGKKVKTEALFCKWCGKYLK